jgi:hypothetical protein
MEAVVSWKCWYVSIRLPGVTFYGTVTFIITDVRIPHVHAFHLGDTFLNLTLYSIQFGVTDKTIQYQYIKLKKSEKELYGSVSY